MMRNSSVTEEENSTTWRRQDGKPTKKLLCNTLWQREQRSSSESGSSLESHSCESQDVEGVSESSSYDHASQDTQSDSKSVGEVTETPTQAQRLLKIQIDGVRACLSSLQLTPGQRDAAAKADGVDAVPSLLPTHLSDPTVRYRPEPREYTAAYEALEGFADLALTGSGLDSGQIFRKANRFLVELQAEVLSHYESHDPPDLSETFWELEASIATLRNTALRLTLGDALESTDSVDELYAGSFELDNMIECRTPGEVLQALTGINFGQTTLPRSPMSSVQPVLIGPSVVPQLTSGSMGSCSTEQCKYAPAPEHSETTTFTFRERTKRPRGDILTHVSAPAASDEGGQSVVCKKRRTESSALL